MKLWKLRGQAGVTLVETIVALSIVGLAMAAFAVATGTSALSLKSVMSENQAASLALAQIEYLKGQPFNASASTYATGVTVPQGYTLATAVLPVAGADSNVQLVRITVTRGGATVLVLDSLKLNRP